MAYQRGTAETAVRRIRGVKGVTNSIIFKPQLEPTEMEWKIQEAIKRNAEVDSNRITVEADGAQAILKGTIRSWVERDEVERAAWAAPGVTEVEDRIMVGVELRRTLRMARTLDGGHHGGSLRCSNTQNGRANVETTSGRSRTAIKATYNTRV